MKDILLIYLKMENFKEPKIIEGGVFKDERGTLFFVNDFNFLNFNIKRFYIVENSLAKPIRGFHGHFKEEKYVLPVSGSALVVLVKIEDSIQPSKTNNFYRFILSADKPSILYIPGGYANGFKSLEAGTKLMFFSNFSLEESKADDYRFPENYWGAEIWEIKNDNKTNI